MNIKNINFGFVFQLVAILSLIIIYIFQWLTMINNPSLRTGTDFIAFYSAGRVAQEYGIENAYKIPLQQKVQEAILGFSLVNEQVLLYNHIPFLIPILSWIVSENYSVSFIIWAIFMLATYWVGSHYLTKIFHHETNYFFIFISAILFFPFFQSLLLGQDTAILFFGIVLWMIGMHYKKDWLTAIGLTLTTVRPHLYLWFMIPLLFHNFKLGLKIIFTTSLLVLISVILINWQGTLDFIRILQISASGTWYGMKENSMFNLIGLLSRSLPFLPASGIRVVGWVGYLAGISVTVFVWKRHKIFDNLLICLSIVSALFFAPHLQYHDLTLLVIPLIMLKIRPEQKSILILGISLILVLLQPFYYILPYGLYVGLTLGLLRAKNQPLETETSLRG